MVFERGDSRATNVSYKLQHCLIFFGCSGARRMEEMEPDRKND